MYKLSNPVPFYSFSYVSINEAVRWSRYVRVVVSIQTMNTKLRNGQCTERSDFCRISRLPPAATKEDKITCQKNPSQGPDLKPELPEFEARMWATLL